MGKIISFDEISYIYQTQWWFNVISVTEVFRNCVLKSKNFGQNSTCSKETIVLLNTMNNPQMTVVKSDKMELLKWIFYVKNPPNQSDLFSIKNNSLSVDKDIFW